MSAERHLLLITYHYPPMGGSGVQRALKLAKYLPCAGWRAHVICAGHRHYPLMDESLSNECPDVDVYPTLGFEPGALAARICGAKSNDARRRDIEDRIYWRLERMVSRVRSFGMQFIEPERLWVSAAVSQARRIHREHPIEAVMTTSPVHATHPVGRHLKRRIGVPWIADLRDPILDNFALDASGAPARRYWKRLERSILTEADQVVVTCPELSERLAVRYGDAIRRPIATIPNGFDATDCPVDLPRRAVSKDRFTLTYVGSFYRDQSIEPILDALRRIHRQRSNAAGRIALRVVGSLSAAQRALLRTTDEAFIEVVGYQNHSEAIREMASADALVLTTPAVEGGRYCIPAKVYEYLAFGGHLLAFVHRGTAIADVLQQAGACTLVEDAGADAWHGAIMQCWAAWQSGALLTCHRAEVVQRFRRDRLAEQYARTIESCVDNGPKLAVSDDSLSSKEAA